MKLVLLYLFSYSVGTGHLNVDVKERLEGRAEGWGPLVSSGLQGTKYTVPGLGSSLEL